jgi:pimeloyl-ACP methyl ester carboxylesterase/membrane protein DedA with SNARE-associated domain
VSRSEESGTERRRPGCLVIVLLIYLALLGVSHVVRLVGAEPAPPPGPFLTVRAVQADRLLDRPVRLAYLDTDPQGDTSRPTILMLHGSPGSKHDFDGIVPELGGRYRLLVPDLPGFGDSTHDVPDYSIRAHAHYVLQMLDQLHVDRVHLVGFSMGGGVALELYDLAPRRVASATLLSAIGVQELELFGDYRLNHAIHATQLGGIWLLREGFPHFGWLDDAFFGVPYARNFFDTDQRPLRDILERFEPPMLIIHGEQDFLVPPEAALEHHRLVPQSELQMLPSSHFMVFTDGHDIADRIASFVDGVDDGAAPSRAQASPERRQAAAAPFDPSAIPPYSGFALLIMMGLIVLATFITEDLACIAAGLLVAHGRIEFAPALVACFIGILAGDVLLFLAGRYIGRPALHRAPLRWFINDEHVEIASRWLDRRGAVLIAISRFVPGTRLPTFFTAGMLHTNVVTFSIYFMIAVAVWTPLLMTLSVYIGERAITYFEAFQTHALPAVIVLALVVLFIAHVIVPAFTFHGRRKLYGRWRRLLNWEFWPPWVFYPPVVAYVAWLGLKYRSPLLFTAANPTIEAGGVIAESKYRILEGLSAAGDFVARARLIPVAEKPEERIDDVRAFMEECRLDFPVVLKPDAGQRGSGVAIVRSVEQLESYLRTTEFDTVVQEYVPGHEFGVFYYRYPGQRHGRIFSITEKRMPHVTGDGRQTIEHLILSDRRAVCMADHYLSAQAHQLFRVPAEGEQVKLVELGTHCRGAIFLDGIWLRTDALERRIDEISRQFRGFYFGRYDIRARDVDELEAGRGFKIIELNGVTSEATHIYDPAVGLRRAYAILFEQWRIAFAIGEANRDRGARPATAREILALIRYYRRISHGHPG